MSRVRLLTILACLVVLLGAQPALACAVCYGDPNSAMTHGAQAGVLVLLGVIGAVLTGFASLLIFWMRRASNLDLHAKTIEEATSVRTATPFSRT